MALPGDSHQTDARWAWAAIGTAAFVLLAVALEVASGTAAGSPVPGWAASTVPLAWPRPLRVVWWAVVAIAAAGHRWALGRLGLHPRRLVSVVVVAPFVAFALAVALGAEWSTFH